jgi:hypothetical protein
LTNGHFYFIAHHKLPFPYSENIALQYSSFSLVLVHLRNSEIDKVFRFLCRIKFLLSATNQHGVHSPFVYNFITKGLYRKGTKTFSVTENVFIKCISYFSCQKIGIIKGSNELKEQLDSVFKNLEYDSLPYDIMYTDVKNEPANNIDSKYRHNETILIITGIYASKESLTLWKEIKKREEVRVTIDVFHCGLVFFRREQVKEHFKIRI